jgi:acetyl-CoA carboxylase biotin carboxyl carrier protein
MPGKNSKGHPPEPGRVWNMTDIQELLDLLAGREITEFEMEQEGVKIRVRRGSAHTENSGNPHAYVSPIGTAPAIVAPPPPPMIPETIAPPTPQPAPAGPEASGESTEGLFVMKSPIVGTFYSSPAPNAPPFVTVGDTVRVGQILCIIEAMKLMNELEAEVAGQIVRIYVENGQPVEYGQSLFAIEPARKK